MSYVKLCWYFKGHGFWRGYTIGFPLYLVVGGYNSSTNVLLWCTDNWELNDSVWFDVMSYLKNGPIITHKHPDTESNLQYLKLINCLECCRLSSCWCRYTRLMSRDTQLGCRWYYYYYYYYYYYNYTNEWHRQLAGITEYLLGDSKSEARQWMMLIGCSL